MFALIESLNESERWFYGLCVLALITWGGQWLAQRLNHGLATSRERRNRRVEAAAIFRTAIITDSINDLRGHALVNALTRVYPTHRNAVDEFRNYLGPIDRFRLNRAWNAYHGGNEEYPDFLVLYGIPKNGTEILKHRLESLRSIGNQT
ncbi:hypothetical protein [Methylocaldum sp. GT1TLB]|uniref:hypothetical protein n=1 Tax=Methylocaldum sp. GT1TLB TaxID=3438965 RepID=UPI003DA1BD83